MEDFPSSEMAFSPYTAKRLVNTLSQAVDKYESQFGTIELDAAVRCAKSE